MITSPKLLYLTHRIPYPPNKGDKIRSYHWLKGLAKKYKIYLGTFIDDENDWQYVDQLNKYCEKVHIERLEPNKAKLKSMKGLLSSRPLTLPYYESKKMQLWINQTIEEDDIKDVLVFSSAMAQYVMGKPFSHLNRVIDFVDIDSDKWLQYASRKKWPMSWVYKREAKTLFQYEKVIAAQFSQSLFVSQKEAGLFREALNDPKANIDYVNNGVDSVFFDPTLALDNPYETKKRILVFTGAMDYWANVDAVSWFVNNHFKKIRARMSDVYFYIVGSNPTKEVLALQKVEGVIVTGKVANMQPYIRYADLAIAPIRVARGIQNKVLEAMAMEKITLVSPQAYEGIQAEPGKALILVQDDGKWADAIINALYEKPVTIGKAARSFVLSQYGWSENIQKLAQIIEKLKRI